MKRISTAFFFGLILMNGLPASPQKVDLKATLMEKQVQDLNEQGLSLVFYINFDNGSDKTYFISGYEYRFVVEEQEYLNINQSLEEGIRIDPAQPTNIALPVKITYDYIFKIIPAMADRSSLSCYITGNFIISDGRRDRGRLPFAFSGEFPVFRALEVEILPLKINALTIGGSDLTFSARFSNPNGFEFAVNRLSYDIKIGGRKVSDGTISGNKNISAAGSRIFEMPLLLSFFEVGKEMYALLQQDEVNCSISGELEIETASEILTIPFDASQRVSIEKAERGF